MTDEVLLIILLAICFLGLFILGIRNLDAWEKRAKYAQALLTLLALLTTGYWFFLERKGMPHADVSQDVTVVPVADGLVAVEAHVRVTNLGQRLLKIDRINSRLQLIRADAYHYDQLNRERGEAYWGGERPNNSKHPEQFHASELRWPIHRRYNDIVKHEIEPGETDMIVVTFLASCSLADWVRVATDVYKPRGSGSPFASRSAREAQQDEEMAWKSRSFVELKKACGKEEQIND